jgi:hypothetical protein
MLRLTYIASLVFLTTKVCIRVTCMSVNFVPRVGPLSDKLQLTGPFVALACNSVKPDTVLRHKRKVCETPVLTQSWHENEMNFSRRWEQRLRSFRAWHRTFRPKPVRVSLGLALPSFEVRRSSESSAPITQTSRHHIPVNPNLSRKTSYNLLTTGSPNFAVTFLTFCGHPFRTCVHISPKYLCKTYIHFKRSAYPNVWCETFSVCPKYAGAVTADSVSRLVIHIANNSRQDLEWWKTNNIKIHSTKMPGQDNVSACLRIHTQLMPRLVTLSCAVRGMNSFCGLETYNFVTATIFILWAGLLDVSSCNVVPGNNDRKFWRKK